MEEKQKISTIEWMNIEYVINYEYNEKVIEMLNSNLLFHDIDKEILMDFIYYFDENIKCHLTFSIESIINLIGGIYDIRQERLTSIQELIHKHGIDINNIRAFERELDIIEQNKNNKINKLLDCMKFSDYSLVSHIHNKISYGQFIEKLITETKYDEITTLWYNVKIVVNKMREMNIKKEVEIEEQKKKYIVVSFT